MDFFDRYELTILHKFLFTRKIVFLHQLFVFLCTKFSAQSKPQILRPVAKSTYHNLQLYKIHIFNFFGKHSHFLENIFRLKRFSN